MKGTYFQRPLEFNLQIEGESWRQGDPISGVLTVKNHGAEAVPQSEIHVVLAHGHLKSVREKAPDAFEILSSVPMSDSGTVEPQKSAQFPWKFQTERNCPITDKSSSLFVLYGQGQASEKLGQLQLMIHPDVVIEEFLKTLQIGFRFVIKTQKASKGAVEVKLAPPTAKAFAMVEQLVVQFRYGEGERLEVRYIFGVKKVEASAASVDLKKQKLEFEQSFGPDEYRLPSGRINHERMELAIRDILSQSGLSALS